MCSLINSKILHGVTNIWSFIEKKFNNLSNEI